MIRCVSVIGKQNVKSYTPGEVETEETDEK